jgi:enamine deaminase RidA (YjgF/YER057c/UK114 family)
MTSRVVHDVSNARNATQSRALGVSTLASLPLSGVQLHVSAQFGTDASGMIVGGFEQQVRQALANLSTALQPMNASLRHVFRAGYHVVGLDASRAQVLAAILRETFGDRPPAGTIVGVSSLAIEGASFQVDAVAAVLEQT